MAHVLIVGGLASSLIRFRGPLIDALLDAGHQVTCAAGEPEAATEAELQRRGVAFYPLALERAGTSVLADLHAVRDIIGLLRRVRPDVIFGYTVKPALYSCLASRITGIGRPYAMLTGLGYALTPQDGARRPGAAIARALARMVLPRAARVFFHNTDDQQFCESHGLIRSTQGLVVDGSGVDLASFPEAPLPDGPITFLCVARLLRDKGIEEFVEAARVVHRRHPNTRFRVAGGRDANPRSVTAEQIAAWERDSPVEFIGHIASPWQEFAASHVFVLPATAREGLPRTLLEAMAVGRPVITSDLPGCRDAIRDNNGLLVAPRDVAQLADAMSRFVETPSMIAAMGARGRTLAVTRFDARRVAAVMLDGMDLSRTANANANAHANAHAHANAVRPRILHIITGLGTGGAEASLLRLLQTTRDVADHAVVSLTTTGTRGSAISALGVPVHALGLARGAIAPSAIGQLRRITRDIKPTCVQGWMYHGNLAASVLALSGAPTGAVVWNVRHALDAWQQESRTLRTLIRVSALFARQPRAIVYNSERAARQHEALGFPSSATRVIPNGVDTARFHPDRDDGARLRATLGIPADDFVVGMIARVDPLKDHDTFLAAVQLHAAMGDAMGDAHHPTTWYLLAGTDTAAGTAENPGALDARIAVLARTGHAAAAPSLASRVIRLGERRDIPAVMNACDVVTMSSRSEGSPNAVAEAMACGVPCVVTDVGDAAALVGESGLVVPVGDAAAIARAWSTLRADHASRHHRGAAALDRIRARYTAQVEAESYTDVWRGAPVEHDARARMSLRASSRASSPTPSPTPRVLMVSTVSVTLRAFLLPFAEHFRARGWQVDGMASGAATDSALGSHFDQLIDVTWTRNPLHPRNLAAARQIRALVRATHYDLIHVHTPVAAFVTRFALRGDRARGPKIVYTAHSFHADRSASRWKNWVFRSLERLAAQWTDHLVVLNRADRDLARQDRLVPDARLHWHPGIGVDVDQYRPATALERAHTRATLGIPDGTALITVVAEFTLNKRQRDVIDAMQLRQRHGLALPIVLFIGDGATREALEARVHALDLSAHIRFLGFRPDVPQLVGASDALMLTSAREGLPRCILEAQAMETPVIGSDAKGTADLLADDRGLLYPVGDVAALAAAIDTVIAHPEAARARAQHAGAWVRANCGLPHLIALHETLYHDVLGDLAARDGLRSSGMPADTVQQGSRPRLYSS